MHRSQSWTALWDETKSYQRRHIYESEPEEPPPWDDGLPEYETNDNRSNAFASSRELLCSTCMLAVLKIYSNRAGTGAFGLFFPPHEACVLCKILRDVQRRSTFEAQQRILAMLKLRIPYPILSKAPPAHMKDLVALYDDAFVVSSARGPQAISKDIEFDGIRAIPRHQLNPAVVRSWLQECETGHSDVCNSAVDWSSKSKHKIWLIDVRHFCLVEKALPCRFVALSYVWGKAQTFRLKRKDIDSYSTLEGLRDAEHQLPLTVMDAIEFVRSIGESYCWVDAICIPQDDEKEMENQIFHMASIYKTAVLTIVAISGEDASSPLYGVRPGTRFLRPFLETPDITLTERAISILPILQSSVYEQRAWTYQERLLSSRCVYFTSEQVFMQCQTGMFREDRVACTPFEKLGRDTFALQPLSLASVEASSFTKDTGLARNFSFYRQITETYTQRSLSYQSDILHAFTGVAEELSRLIDTPMVAGMPEKFLFRAMLFQSRQPMFSKRTADMKHLDPNTNELLSLAFPTWSWSGWMGLVDYHNVGSVITHTSRIQICASPARTTKASVEFRTLAKTIEPQSSSDEIDFAAFPKPNFEFQTFTLRFKASIDAAGSFKFEPSPKGDNFLSVTGPNGLTCGLVRLDGGAQLSPVTATEKPRPFRKETRSVALILLCDIERDLIKQPDQPDKSSPRKPWGPKIYYDNSPWRLCAVLYVSWKGGVAQRLGIGEIVKDVWRRANVPEQIIYLT